MRAKTVELAMTFVLAILFWHPAQPQRSGRERLSHRDSRRSAQASDGVATKPCNRACVSWGTWRGRTSYWSTATRKGTSPSSPSWRPNSSGSTLTSSWRWLVPSGPGCQACDHDDSHCYGKRCDRPGCDGMVESLARPGGNITGFTIMTIEMAGKRLELFKAAVPTLGRVAVLYDPANPGNVLHAQAVQTAGHALGLTVQLWEVRGTDDFERVFAALREERPDGLYMPGGPLTGTNEKRIVDFAVTSRFPSVYDSREAVEAGALMSYANDIVDQSRRLASYVDRIYRVPNRPTCPWSSP